jgi:hypothetical protein
LGFYDLVSILNFFLSPIYLFSLVGLKGLDYKTRNEAFSEKEKKAQKIASHQLFMYNKKNLTTKKKKKKWRKKKYRQPERNLVTTPFKIGRLVSPKML